MRASTQACASDGRRERRDRDAVLGAVAAGRGGQSAGGAQVGEIEILALGLLLLGLLHELHVGEHVEFGGDAEDFGFLESVAPGVSVGIDQAGEESVASGIDDFTSGRNFQILADSFDFAAFDPDVGVVQELCGHRTRGRRG